MPFTSRSAWKTTQQDCPALRRVYAHLIQGTRPSRKATNIREVKRYLHDVTVSNDGLLVVKKNLPFLPTRELTVIPQHVLQGLLHAIHLKLQHPSKAQLGKLFHRHFYALNSDRAISSVSQSCSQCSSIATLPQEIPQFSTSEPPSTPGSAFACDVMCRSRQKIFVLRDCFSSFTITRIIANEQRDTLRSIIVLFILMHLHL